MHPSKALRTSRWVQPALFACGLAAAALPAAATERSINCTRQVADSYATLMFEFHELDIASGEGEVDHVLELEFLANVVVHLTDPTRPGWVGPELCRGGVIWHHDVPELDILYGGFMRYPFADRVSVYNVPRNSVVTFDLTVIETDGGLNSNDWGDLNPGPGSGTMELTLWPAEGRGRTPQVAPGVRDLTFGQRKRVVGDTSGIRSDFRAAVEFTVSMSLAAGGVSGAVGGPPPPQVGGAIPNDSRGTGPTGPGQAITSREDRCRAYAESAFQQNLQAQQLNCGYAPPVWNSDRNAHYAWCMQANNVELTQAGWLLREAGLATCRQQNP